MGGAVYSRTVDKEPHRMNRSFRFLLRAALAALALATTVSCETAAKSEGTIVSPTLIASAELPFSESRAIALLADGRTACVVDSYEVRVRCVDPDGSVVGLFGREGEGPGEFEWPYKLSRGATGTVGIVDRELRRFSVFEPSGSLVTTVHLVGSYIDPNPFGGTVSGVEITARRDAILAGAGPGGYQTFYEIVIETGAVLRQAASPPVPVQVGCGRATRGPPFKYGLPSPHGGWAFLACAGHMVFVPEDGTPTVIQSQAYSEVLPTEREIAEVAADVERQMRKGLPIGPDFVTRFSSMPKRYQLATDKLMFDSKGRLWVATFRDHHDFSYLDVFAPDRYLGTVRVRDRVWGFDILESTLVVVVDRMPETDEPDALPTRGLDWYDIGVALPASPTPQTP